MRSFLIVLLSITCIFSLTIGTMMVITPIDAGINLSLLYLKGTPFKNYLIPGILLLLFIFSTSFYATVQLIKRNRRSIHYSFISGICLSVWMMVQMLLVSQTVGISLLFILIGILIILISAQLRGIEAI